MCGFYEFSLKIMPNLCARLCRFLVLRTIGTTQIHMVWTAINVGNIFECMTPTHLGIYTLFFAPLSSLFNSSILSLSSLMEIVMNMSFPRISFLSHHYEFDLNLDLMD